MSHDKSIATILIGAPETKTAESAIQEFAQEVQDPLSGSGNETSSIGVGSGGGGAGGATRPPPQVSSWGGIAPPPTLTTVYIMNFIEVL